LRVLSVVGNRPQFVKSAPLSVALREAGIEEVVLHTGQHYDPELSHVFFEELELSEPQHSLDLRTADPVAMQAAIAPLLERERPEWVLVYGDTNSTLAGALASAGTGVPLAHVEAGLRSGDLAMPEERNRIDVDRLAQLLLAPDERSAQTLRAEGVGGAVQVVGDVMADAARVFAPIAQARSTIHRRTGVRPGQPYAVLTIHREANTEPERLRMLISELNGTGWTYVFPVHPRTRRVLDEHRIEVAPYLHQIEPIGYLDMLALVAGATRVVTDSGGMQKESYWLGIPCITLRPSTEWIDTVRAGANTLVSPETQAELTALGPALANAKFPATAPELYGDGHAAERIAEALVRLAPE
jgi:UDP-N-acetylglucosamine 2-epimerase